MGAYHLCRYGIVQLDAFEIRHDVVGIAIAIAIAIAVAVAIVVDAAGRAIKAKATIVEDRLCKGRKGNRRRTKRRVGLAGSEC